MALDPPPLASLDPARLPIVAVRAAMDGGDVLGVPVGPKDPLPDDLDVDRDTLEAAGFDGEVGSILPTTVHEGSTGIAIGIGPSDELTPGRLRDAAAAFAKAASSYASLAFAVGPTGPVSAEEAAQALTEGALLARYRYDALKGKPDGTSLTEVTLVTGGEHTEAVSSGAERGRVFASATMLARDLANTPHSHLNASILARIAQRLGSERGFEVEVFDEEACREMRIGGLLGVNRGSAEPPRLIKLSYRPDGTPTGSLAMVGKGIMYDSGGISLKPSDPIHAQMKNDMSGAATILAAIASLSELGSTTAVTGYLMCTDNMPSGSALALGDVLTIRDGTTVEVIDTDAEGRLVLSDGLVLAAEGQPDAIVDIATLTGSVQRALGSQLAGLFGNDEHMIDAVRAAGRATDEIVWQLPLHTPYRSIIESDVADLANCGPVGLPDGIVAAVFLSRFVGDLPWAHIDIAGVTWSDEHRPWLTKGCTGFGARLLLELALSFTPPRG